MIVRVSEAWVRDGAQGEFMERLVELVAGFGARFEGFLGDEILVDSEHDRHVLYISRWRDELALVSFAGQGWASTPVTFPNETDLLERPLSLRHFVDVSRPDARASTHPNLD